MLSGIRCGMMLVLGWAAVAGTPLRSGAQVVVGTAARWARPEHVERPLAVVPTPGCYTEAAPGGSAPGDRRLLPLRADDAASRRRLAWGDPIAISSDQRWVSYTLTTPERIAPLDRASSDATANGVPMFVRGSELWLCNLRNGMSHDLTGSGGVSWGGVWSPDGQHMAFYSDRDGRPRLWMWDARTGETRRVSSAIVTSFYPFEIAAWVPDGRSLLVKLAAESERAATRPRGYSSAVPGVHVYRSDPEQLQSPAARPETRRRGADSMAAVRRYLGDLAVVSLATGQVRRLVRGQGIANYFVSPRSDAVAYVVVHGFDALNSQDNRVDINIVQLANGQVHSVAVDLKQSLTGLSVSWSPDGRWLAYSVTTLSHAAAGDCYVVPAGGGAAINATPGPHPDFSDDFRGPLWDPRGDALYFLGGDTLWRAGAQDGVLTPLATVDDRELRSIIASSSAPVIWSPDTAHALYVWTRDAMTGRSGIAQVNLDTEAAHLVFEEDRRGVLDQDERFGLDAAGSTVVYANEASDVPPDLWISRDGFRTRSQLTHINPTLDRYVFGRSRLVEWLSLDGLPLRGALLLPAGYTASRRYPLVVQVYGGASLSRNVNAFGLEGESSYDFQLLATRGYAVLAPDAPMGTVTPMLDLAKTVLPGVNRAIELGVADSSRLAVMGESYGGYSTLALLVQTPRFRAAVSTAAVSSDLLTEYGQQDAEGFDWGMGWAEQGQGRMRATPWERRDRYVENSPYFYLDRVQTPLLLIHGVRDEVAPAYGDDQTFTALRRLGKEVEYVRYDAADHVLSSSPLAELGDYQLRITNWLGAHLGVADVSAADSAAGTTPVRTMSR